MQIPPVLAGVALYTVTYLSEGLRVKALLAVPHALPEDEEGAKREPLPAILYCRGGYRGVGQVKPERIAQLASFGFVVMAPHYRGNEGGEGADEFGGRDLHDVYAALHWLQGLPIVDRTRISLYGFSRGGMMALLAAMECTGIQAVVVWSGVTDMLLTYEERSDLRRMLKRLVGHPDKHREAYLARSPYLRAEQITCPVLIIHGTEDHNVGVAHARKLADALSACGHPHELWLAEGARHLFQAPEMEHYTRRMIAWLKQQKPVHHANASSVNSVAPPINSAASSVNSAAPPINSAAWAGKW